MASTFRINVDLGPVMARLGAAAEVAVRRGAEHVLTEANKSVPHDEGTLERSGSVASEKRDRGATAVFAYDTPYAVRQHEDMSLNHHGKGEAKWLENTATREASTVAQIVATELRQALT